RFSGFQVGASLTPVVETRKGGPGTDEGDEGPKADGDFENAIGLGANYDNSFGSLRVRASAVYATASSNLTGIEDVSAWSVGGIVGFGPFSVGANYTDNGESARVVGSGVESSYWNVAASFETGPIYLAAGYMASSLEGTGFEDTMETISLTADYSVAPGLAVYGEIDLISDEYDLGPTVTNDATIFIVGANVSF
ncbi:MAG: porin, partial [Alphaproteobacteria bacterium]|nr:porin [Alphaproteobacteria bacterium]